VSRIVVTTIGSLGDLHPQIAIALELQQRGHDVVFVTHIIGVRYDRKLADGRQVCDLCKRGQQVHLHGLSFPVTLSWLYLKRDGKFEKRFVLSTRPLKGSTITWWGKRRWAADCFYPGSLGLPVH
jgi:hypothetical protein